MNNIISIHSYRGGTGKSNTSANISAILAEKGLRVGVVDTDIPSPGIHVLFGLDEDDMGKTLNDYLFGRCEIAEAAQDVTHRLGVPVDGKVFLVPASINPAEISQIVREGYDPVALNDGFEDLLDDLALDVLIIDTHPGLNDETLLSIAISDALAIILRPDQQDFQGTHVTVQVAKRLHVPTLYLLVNKAPELLDHEVLKEQVEQTYNVQTAAVLPHSDEMMTLASSGIFALHYPDHPITVQLRHVAELLLGEV
ncbi:MAG: MinD/ParA family protein [Anaerolineae bacterium]